MARSNQYSHETYLSPFTWRYGSAEMRGLWSEVYKRQLWRRIWVALAETQAEFDLVDAAQVEDLRQHIDDIDIERAHAIEAEIKHDLMAEVKTFAAQCPVGGGIIHLGATSMDIEDNCDALRLKKSMALVVSRLRELLTVLTRRIDELADIPTMAFTHLQPAEPTTMGYRLAQYAFDLYTDLHDLSRLRDGVCGKGFKGATGTSAAYDQLLSEAGVLPSALERGVMNRLHLDVFPVATQTYARKQDYRLLSGLASLAQSLYKFAADLRILQSPPLGEWAEPFGDKQVGSSAMPFKRNPINAENICSLARVVANAPQIAWDNAAHSYLERTLDDSANRRSILPESFLAVDEMLTRSIRLLDGLQVDKRAAERLMQVYGPFAATERLMMELAKRGADRQALHALIRGASLTAWSALRRGETNPLKTILSTHPDCLALASSEEILSFLDGRDYVGDAPGRARTLSAEIRIHLG